MIKMPLKVPSFRVDWPNHIIGFFSALFGILIAFQLEEWRDQRAQRELTAAAFRNLKQEVEDNRVRLNTNVSDNMVLITDIKRLLLRLDDKLRFTGMSAEADSLNAHPSSFVLIDNSGPRPYPVRIGLYGLQIPVLQTAAWESSKATGALNYMEYEWVIAFSSLYNNPQIIAEIDEIRDLWRRTDDSHSKKEFERVLSELEKAHNVIRREMRDYDQWLSIISNLQ
jgi:hypothetical protein